MDSFLITLLVIAIAGVSNWLQHRAKAREQQPHLPSPHIPGKETPPSAPRPTMESTLERELRRLLGEEIPEPVRPRPVPAHPQPHPQSPPPPVQQRQVLPPPPVKAVTKPPPVPRPAAAAIPTRARLGESRVAYDRAQQLQESVGKRLREIDERTEKHGPKALRVLSAKKRRPPSPLFAVRHDRQAARHAFAASLVFGLPKALEE